jgi:hypothetical protein
MKPAAFLTLAFALASSTAFAQTGEDAVNTSRQAELPRLAALYTIDLTHGDWQHERADICPTFTRHSFVFYHRSPQPGVRTSFMVAYPRSGNGPATIVPIEGSVIRKPIPAPDNPITIAAFNTIWSDELTHSPRPGTLPGLTWGGFAQCYASLAGEHPIVVIYDDTIVPDPPFNLKAAPVSGMLIPIANTQGNLSRGVHIEIDERGMISHASLGTTGPIIAGPTEKNPLPVTTGPTEKNPLPITTRQN